MKKIHIFISILLSLTSVQTAFASGSLFEYQVDGLKYEGYYISPAVDSPFVLLLHDWDGLTDYEIKRANMLAEKGYTVLAADLFGAGIRPTEVKDKKQHTGELYKDRQKLRALMNGALQVAKEKGANVNNAVAIGYCFGGAAVLELARSGADLKGFVTFHGGLSIPEGQNYSKTKGKLLILHGTADANITMDQFAFMAEMLEEEGISHEMITYSGAQHGFTVYDSAGYNQEADQKSWQRFLDFLAKTVD